MTHQNVRLYLAKQLFSLGIQSVLTNDKKDFLQRGKC